MSKYDSNGREILASEWGAISGIPPFVSAIGALVSPGSGDWLLLYDADTDTWSFTSSSALTVTAADVSYTPPSTDWASNLQDVTDEIIAALDVLAADIAALEAGLGVDNNDFTATLQHSGTTTITTGTMYHSIVGNRCTLHIGASALAGDPGAGTVTIRITGIPAAARPVAQRNVACIVENKGNATTGFVQVNNDGTADIQQIVVSGAELINTPNFVGGSGAMGLVGGWTVTYALTNPT